MEIFVFISCGVQTKTFKVEAGGCKSIKAYHLFAIGNLNVNNTDMDGGVKIISAGMKELCWELNRFSKEDSLQMGLSAGSGKCLIIIEHCAA